MEFLKNINESFSGIMSVAVSLITMVVTLIYVLIVNKQMKASEQSVKVAIDQIKQSNQPCIIPAIGETIGTECFNKSRRQLHIEIELENIGDSPAISIFVMGFLELQHSMDEDNDSKIIYRDYPPAYINSMKSGSTSKADITFETREITHLVHDLSIAMKKNYERIKNEPSKTRYHGTSLIIEVYYKNALGQWFKSIICREIAWLIITNEQHPEHPNLNKYTVPPKALKPDNRFELQLIAPRFSKSNTELVSEDMVKGRIDKFMDEFSQSSMINII